MKATDGPVIIADAQEREHFLKAVLIQSQIQETPIEESVLRDKLSALEPEKWSLELLRALKEFEFKAKWAHYNPEERMPQELPRACVSRQPCRAFRRDRSVGRSQGFPARVLPVLLRLAGEPRRLSGAHVVHPPRECRGVWAVRGGREARDAHASESEARHRRLFARTVHRQPLRPYCAQPRCVVQGQGLGRRARHGRVVEGEVSLQPQLRIVRTLPKGTRRRACRLRGS